jgi:methionine sulfoxide reductase heme-binding subunit
MLRIVLNYKPLLWLILGVPGVMMLYGVISGRAEAIDLLHPSGEFSARLMILAMMIGPAVALFGAKGWLVWLMQRRRTLGVAAFLYALLHLVFYIIDMETLKDIMAEFLALGIWTGWAAFVLMLVPAAISNDAAMRALKRNWKRIQQLAYGAAVLTLLHWIYIDNDLGPALVHFIPLALLQAARFVKPFIRSPQGA